MLKKNEEKYGSFLLLMKTNLKDFHFSTSNNNVHKERNNTRLQTIMFTSNETIQ